MLSRMRIGGTYDAKLNRNLPANQAGSAPAGRPPSSYPPAAPADNRLPVPLIDVEQIFDFSGFLTLAAAFLLLRNGGRGIPPDLRAMIQLRFPR